MQPVTQSAQSRSVAPARAAIYARVSSDQQAERHTIDSQVRDLLARAAETTGLGPATRPESCGISWLAVIELPSGADCPVPTGAATIANGDHPTGQRC